MTMRTLYQVNTRVWLGGLSAALRRQATLDDLPDAELDRLAGLGFDALWCLGVWETGPTGQEIARALPELRREYLAALPDLTDADICGSCFAITRYAVHPALGGLPALERLRGRLHRRGMRLVLDFVPNHTARDHPWAAAHPEFYVQGSQEDLARRPHDYCAITAGGRRLILAHGRDPFFPGWTDTLQLNYGNPALQEAMRGELLKIAGWCDGLRCDMAMLVLSSVFQMTWRLPAAPFWPRAIREVRARHPDFVFLAEVYWDLEWTLQDQGFDYTYDKRLYDRLRQGSGAAVREHLMAEMAFQRKLARFLENHDEPRAASVFPPEQHRAAAVLAFLVPGLRFVHQGQLEGRKVRLPVQLCRAPGDPVDAALQAFYERLLACLQHPAIREGEWRLLMPAPAWEGNPTWNAFVAFAWAGATGRRLLITVNYGATQAQCYVGLPFAEPGRALRLRDQVSPAAYERSGDELREKGLYLDLPAWGYHVFEPELLP